MGTNQVKVTSLTTPRRGIRGYWWLAFVLALFGLALMPLDIWLAQPGNLEYLPGDLKRFVSLSEIFAHGFGVGILALGILFLARPQSRLIPRIMMCAFWPAAGVHLIKICFGRVRPVKYLDEFSNFNYPAGILDTWVGWMPRDQFNVFYATQSFPSAHAATTWGLAIGMSWAFPRGRWLFFFVATLASVQRVTSFAHWPSDVCFGAAIAFVMAGSITQNWGLGKLFGRFEACGDVDMPKLVEVPMTEPLESSRRAA